MPADSSETRKRILDAALYSFAERGLDGASLRGIATRAHTTLALVQYHFGSKELLYRAVWEAMTAPNTSRRRAELEQFDFTQPFDVAIRKVIAIFADPLIAAVGTPRGKAFLAIVGREAFDPKEDEHGVIHDFADDDARRMIDVFAQLIPAATRSQITQTYLWMTFAFMQMIASDGRLRRLSAPERAEFTVQQRLTSMTAFMIGGWTALANQTAT